MQGWRVLIAGCGDIGSALGQRLARAGCEVFGLRRQAALIPPPIHPIAVDLSQPAALRRALPHPFDAVVVSTTAGHFDAESYRRVYVEGLGNLLQALTGQPRVILVSSTSVYHQSAGEWVDEDSPTLPTRFPGQLQLEAERLLQEQCAARATVVRFGGIYGPGRERLIGEVRAGIGCPREPPQYSNRIHRDDCVGVLEFLLQRLAAGQAPDAALYLGVDSEPATQWELRHWLAQRIGVELDDNAVSRSARAAGSKRCGNARLLRAGYRLLYPSYREGYAALLAQA